MRGLLGGGEGEGVSVLDGERRRGGGKDREVWIGRVGKGKSGEVDQFTIYSVDIHFTMKIDYENHQLTTLVG